MGATSPERHREVAVTPFKATWPERLGQSDTPMSLASPSLGGTRATWPERHHKVAPAGSDMTGATQQGATSPERHREVAVTPFKATWPERLGQSDTPMSLASPSLGGTRATWPERHHKVAPAGSDMTGATQQGRSRRATRSDVSQRPLQVAPEAWSDLSKRLLEFET
uniref:Uncharacterized protein n=1 Tax=Brassica oleracea var. oleracea TaxID=109376 RepID=A0A0D3DJJ5_BRAOL